MEDSLLSDRFVSCFLLQFLKTSCRWMRKSQLSTWNQMKLEIWIKPRAKNQFQLEQGALKFCLL